MLQTSEPASDRRLNLLLGASVATALAIILIAVVAIPKILANASTTEAIQRGNELTACRAGFRVEVDDAAARLQSARARLDALTNEGLEATARNDDAALLDLVPLLAPARQDVTDGAARLERVTDRYRELVDLSRTGQDRFLRICRQEGT